MAVDPDLDENIDKKNNRKNAKKLVIIVILLKCFKYT